MTNVQYEGKEYVVREIEGVLVPEPVPVKPMGPRVYTGKELVDLGLVNQQETTSVFRLISCKATLSAGRPDFDGDYSLTSESDSVYIYGRSPYLLQSDLDKMLAFWNEHHPEET